MRTVYYTASSLDGFLADESHGLEWLFQFGEVESLKDHYPRFLARVGALAMGASTYAWLLRHERMVESPERWPYTIPAFVFTHRELPPVPGADVRFLQGDVAGHLPALRAAAGDRDLWVVGGGDLAGQFHDAGHLDELVVTLASVTLGRGAPLLPRRLTSPPLRLRSVERHGEAFAVLHYDVGRP